MALGRRSHTRAFAVESGVVRRWSAKGTYGVEGLGFAGSRKNVVAVVPRWNPGRLLQELQAS
jgi:hypothetical protein